MRESAGEKEHEEEETSPTRGRGGGGVGGWHDKRKAAFVM